MTIVITRTAKQAGTSTPDQWMLNATAEILATLPAYGYDLAAVVDQQNMFSLRDQLNATSVFKVLDYGSTVINDSGLLVFTLTYMVEDVSTVPGLTVDNAYDMCIGTRQTQAEALGIGDFQGWRQKHFDDVFTTTCQVTTA
jgi:hypothetical protein